MTSGRQNQVAWQRQPHNRVRRLRLVSPCDVTYALAALFLSGMQLIPPSLRVCVINRVCESLSGFLYTVNAHSTRTIRQNLKAVSGRGSPSDGIADGVVAAPRDGGYERFNRGADGVERDVRRLLSMTIWNSLVIHALPALTKQQIVNLVPVDGLSCLDDHLAAGRPVLVWCYHFGVHHLIVAALLHARGYPIHVVAHALHMPAGASIFQRFYLRRLQRISGQFPMIDPQEGPERTMLDVFRSKQCLCITPDYMIPEAQPRSAFEVPVDFLGHRACLHTGGLRLAKRFHAGVVTILSVQQDDHERRLIVEPFDLPTVGFTPVELQRDLQMCMQRLEAQVLAYPCLWWDLKRDDLLERLEVIPCDDQPA